MPTYVTTIGRFGAAIAERLEADPPAPGFAVCRVRGPAELAAEQRAGVLPWFRATVLAGITPLLRAAATGGGAGRLDLVMIADVVEVGGPILVALAQTLSEVLAAHFAVMFPPETPAEQRGVGLIVVLATPAFDRSDDAQTALAALHGLTRWHRGGPPSPILNRVFVLPRQNEVMPLADADVERAVALFVAAAFRAGLRDSDTFRHRLGPPRDPDRLIDAFAVAAADVDVPRLIAAFGWRSGLAALARLAAQCEARGAPGHALELDVDGWLAPVHGEPPATTLTARAGAASPAELDALVRAVDGAEGDVVVRTRKAIADAVDGRLGGDDGLVAFGAVRQGLERAAERARATAKAPAAWLPSADEVAAAEAEVAAERDADRAPASETSAPAAVAMSPVLTGALLALVCGAAAAAIAAVASVRASTKGASAGAAKVVSAAAPVGADATTAILWGVLAGAIVGGAWIGASKLLARRRRERTDEADRARVTPQGARQRRLRTAIGGGLAVRHRRVARAAETMLLDERTRLDALRGAIHDAAARCRARLTELGVTPADDPAVGVTPANDPAADDASRLWDPETPLHLALLPAAALPTLWERSRAVREDERWAARLLARAWPRGGHRDDLPFAGGAAWEQAARDQHASLAEAGVFEWPEVGAAVQAQLQRLLATAPGALGLGVRPRRADGTPESLTDARELLIVAPPEGRAALDRALSTQPIADARILAGARGDSRVLILRTAGELSVDALTRGATT